MSIHDSILSREPPFKITNELYHRGLGFFVGGHVDTWTWNKKAVRALPEDLARIVFEQLIPEGPMNEGLKIEMDFHFLRFLREHIESEATSPELLKSGWENYQSVNRIGKYRSK